MNYNNLSQIERDNMLKNELTKEKVNLIDRYRLVSTRDLKWISKKENSHQHIIFSHRFILNSDILGSLFRVNYLCFAKLKYFRENMHKFEPARYHPVNGFEKVEVWDSDFLKHKKSGKYIDYNFLQRITDIEVFKKFCDDLETII
ncbi:MAG: hypothetical protein P1P88_07785 [Bacteroidales bacterium]|nr:hypothetical protein [Bacteroidales bacterium]